MPEGTSGETIAPGVGGDGFDPTATGLVCCTLQDSPGLRVDGATTTGPVWRYNHAN